MPLMAMDRGTFWLVSPKYPLLTYHAEVNGMASPIQTVIGKDESNPLTAEGLLKILKGVNRECSYCSLQSMLLKCYQNFTDNLKIRRTQYLKMKWKRKFYSSHVRFIIIAKCGKT